MSFSKGEIYRRRDIHNLYGGQEQGGISTPSKHSFILLFSSTTGEQYGYSDGWNADGIYLYTGEGQKGDMEFVRGNRAIRDHEEAGKSLHLFQSVRQGHVQYIGQMRCNGFHFSDSNDVDGNKRRVIVFELVSVTQS
jgi:5-methylcytosine-specific restriction protein A